MIDCNSVLIPAYTTTLGLNNDGDSFNETWKYSTVLGMLMYLARTSCPDIAFAVHQCARFRNAPRQSNAKEVKQLLRYIKGTEDKVLIIEPSHNIQVYCC